jgi:hypothetical protein
LHHACESSINNVSTKEITMTQLRDALIVSILLVVVTHLVWSAVYPHAYGEWLKKIDDGRYEFLDQEGI